MTGPAATGTAQEAPPFSGALGLEPLGGGRYAAMLGERWAVGSKAHGGILLALLAKAALTEVAAKGTGAADLVALSSEFLRAPDLGPVEIVAEIVKGGRTVSVATARMIQGGRLVLTATVTAGALPDADPEYADLPDLAPEPPPDALDPSTAPRRGPNLGTVCDLRLDRATAHFATGGTGAPLIRGWVRPVGEDPDPLFLLVAGDILPPTLFNTGRPGWAPTVQLTALVRARPVPGWLRLQSSTRTVSATWFDEDMTVVDSAGRLVCQARQLALAPLPRDGA